MHVQSYKWRRKEEGRKEKEEGEKRKNEEERTID